MIITVTVAALAKKKNLFEIASNVYEYREKRKTTWSPMGKEYTLVRDDYKKVTVIG